MEVSLASVEQIFFNSSDAFQGAWETILACLGSSENTWGSIHSKISFVQSSFFLSEFLFIYLFNVYTAHTTRRPLGIY